MVFLTLSHIENFSLKIIEHLIVICDKIKRSVVGKIKFKLTLNFMKNKLRKLFSKTLNDTKLFLLQKYF